MTPAFDPDPNDGAAIIRLKDDPDVFYLLREFELLYRYGSNGGSRTIRAHRRRVREILSSVIAADPVLVARPAETKPITGHLPRALDLGERGSMATMARAMRALRTRLTWEYGYARMPVSRKYAYCEVLGPRGPVPCETLILGFVLFAPDTTYPQHSHHDIEESYVSVAGAWSENDAAVYAPGSLILNRSGEEHRITTGPIDPCLLAYAWTGPAAALTTPDMKLSSTRKRRG